MYADHPTLVIITGSFLQIARSSSRYGAHPDRGIPTPRRRTCVRVYLTHTCYPPVLRLARTLSRTRRYTCHYNDTPAIPCRRTLGSPGRPYVEEATLFFTSSSFSKPADPTFLLSLGEHLVERAAPSNRIFKSRRLFEEVDNLVNAQANIKSSADECSIRKRIQQRGCL
ncbi:Uncharacterized protein DBV15_02817 [Temnothorax longispinosus]|uniref:Uncharacterized protein n=1 Tax=Temnothorax longispinosus TaxID=300112 RepID=A0A4V3SCH3_9HYME|nr:Uncharacterized protein DBV15_02817 [Temnothorax longispinosus]